MAAALKVRVEPLERDVALLIDEVLSPKARSQMIANAARQARDEALKINKQALGRDSKYDQYVDGRKGAALESVNPDRGRIIFEFDLLLDVFRWIGAELVQHSPVFDMPIHYFENHLFFADGVQVIPGEKVPEADEYIFVNAVPYARKIERGLSPQAPDGVYQVVAKLASRRFGNVARIRYVFSTIHGGERNPAISIKVGGGR